MKLKTKAIFFILILCPQAPLLAKKIKCPITAIEKDQVVLSCGLESGVSVGDHGSVVYQIKLGATTRTIVPATLTIIDVTPVDSTAHIEKMTGELKTSYSAEIEIKEVSAPPPKEPASPQPLPSPERASEALAIMERATLLYQSGKLEEAKAAYEQVLALVPNDPLAKTRLLEIENTLSEKNLLKAQIDYYKAAAASASNRREYYLAKEYAAKALTLDPDDPQCQHLYLAARQDFDHAIFLNILPRRVPPRMVMSTMVWKDMVPPPVMEAEEREAPVTPPRTTSRSAAIVPRETPSAPKPRASGRLSGSLGVTPMVLVPAAEFMMGEGRKTAKFRNEMPEHMVHVNEFYIDKYEVTNGQYQRFVEATHRTPPRNWNNGVAPEDRVDYPVTGVSWFDAAAYCAFVEKRLPSEAEWEFSGRGPSGLNFPWGNKFEARLTDTSESNRGDAVAVTADSGDVSAFGVQGLGGNVSEWIADWYQAYPDNDYPEVDYGQRSKVVRGGSFETQWVFSRNGFRGYRDPNSPAEDIGFRCAQSPSAHR
ncbi:MAG: SUMF1/EgtB/PvdO family nonheme iron enzyme [Acidobacteriia bacterium]|nr:SUMF1/EgtB/PvdO family nonheme iron enzyme [Terriglobia bacterium]